MISKLLFLGAGTSLLLGYYGLLLQRKLDQMMIDIDKATNYDLDYIHTSTDIPEDILVVISGNIDEDFTQGMNSQFNPKKKLVFSAIFPEYLHPKKTIPEDNKLNEDGCTNTPPKVNLDHMEHEYYELNNIPQIVLRNTKQDRVLIEQSNSIIGLYNFPFVKDKIDLGKLTTKPWKRSLIQRIQDYMLGRKYGTNYREIGLDIEERYVYVGNMFHNHFKTTSMYTGMYDYIIKILLDHNHLAFIVKKMES